MKPNATYTIAGADMLCLFLQPWICILPGLTLEFFSFHSIVRIFLLNLNVASDESNLKYLYF